MARSIIPDLKADCGRLITQYVELGTTSFTDFIDVWKACNFDLIYAGQGENEIDYFIFQILNVAMGFCLPSKSRLEKVAGLYLLYLLYYTQPLKSKKSIRLIPEEYDNLKEMAEEFKSENKEVSYAFYKLLVDHSFDFVVTPLPYDENLIHHQDEFIALRQTSCESVNHKALVDMILDKTGFEKSDWSKMVNDYNNSKKKINRCSSLNLSLTKDFNLDNPKAFDPSTTRGNTYSKK